MTERERLEERAREASTGGPLLTKDERLLLKAYDIADPDFRVTRRWSTEPVKQLLRDLLALIKRLTDEEEVYHQTLGRQSQLLRDTVNVLRGPPPELVWWSHHDIPELAAEAVRERDEAKALIERITEIYQAGIEAGDFGNLYTDPDNTLDQIWDALNGIPKTGDH